MEGALEQPSNVSVEIEGDGMEDNSIVTGLLFNYYDRFSNIARNFQSHFVSHDQRLLKIKESLESLDSRISENKRDVKKRMLEAIQVSEDLR